MHSSIVRGEYCGADHGSPCCWQANTIALMFSRARDAWRRRQPALRRHASRLVFIHETSINTKMMRLHGHGLKGHRLKAKAPSDIGKPKHS
jgi:hypothetical protein